MRSLIATFCLVSGFAILGSVYERGEAHLRFDSPSVISTTQAIYPPRSIASGTVILEVGVDGSGKIGDVRVVHDIPSLTEPARESVHQWKFEPARLNGEPVKSKVTVAFTFVSPNLAPSVQYH